MTVAELLEILLDDDVPRTATVRVGTLTEAHMWELGEAHARLGGPDPEIVLEIEGRVGYVLNAARSEALTAAVELCRRDQDASHRIVVECAEAFEAYLLGAEE